MYNFKLNKVLSIISYSIDEENYELDFAICEYDYMNEDLYQEAIIDGFADVWENKIEEII